MLAIGTVFVFLLCFTGVTTVHVQELSRHVIKRPVSDLFSGFVNILAYPKTLTEIDDVVYKIGVSIGKPAQQFDVALQIEGTDLWVADSLSVNLTQIPKNVKTFHRPASSTFKYDRDEAGNTFIVNGAYNQLSYSAQRAFETVSLEYYTAVKNQSFSLLYNFTGTFPEKTDGVLGVGFPTSQSKESQHNFVSPVHTYVKTLDKHVFSIWLNPTDSNTTRNVGTITFGGYDTTHCLKDWVTFQKSESTACGADGWSVQAENFTIGTYENHNPFQISFTNVNTFAVVPASEWKTIANVYGITEDNDWLDCHKLDYMASIDFVLQGTLFSFPPDKFFNMRNQKDGKCQFNLISGQEDCGWRVGLEFFKGTCQQFNVDTRQVSFSLAYPAA